MNKEHAETKADAAKAKIIHAINLDPYAWFSAQEVANYTKLNKVLVRKILNKLVGRCEVSRKLAPKSGVGRRPYLYQTRSVADLVKVPPARTVAIDEADAARMREENAKLREENAKLKRQVEHLKDVIKITIFDLSVGDATDYQLRQGLADLESQ